MPDAAASIIRFALYLDLMILFGVPLFGLYGLRGVERSPAAAKALGHLLAAVAIAGLVLSSFAVAQLTASMSGVPLGKIDWASVSMLVSETSIGTAWQARMIALALFLALVFIGNVARAAQAWMLSFLGAMALATMAWGGHGAMSEGTVGTIHLAADIIHLLAAGVWVAALLSLAILLFRPHRQMSAAHVEFSHGALASFAVVGSVVVAILFISGLVNSWILIGWSGIASLPFSTYGQLLITKLLLFAVMLGLAALNRYRLTPALEAAIATGDHAAAVKGLRQTLAIETSCAVIILILVAWLGSLAPPATL